LTHFLAPPSPPFPPSNFTRLLPSISEELNGNMEDLNNSYHEYFRQSVLNPCWAARLHSRRAHDLTWQQVGCGRKGGSTVCNHMLLN
jgi:hypothetical protein